jgi:hypothetical protein
VRAGIEQVLGAGDRPGGSKKRQRRHSNDYSPTARCEPRRPFGNLAP